MIERRKERRKIKIKERTEQTDILGTASYRSGGKIKNSFTSITSKKRK